MNLFGLCRTPLLRIGRNLDLNLFLPNFALINYLLVNLVLFLL